MLAYDFSISELTSRHVFKALLGSLVFGATWSDGSDLDDVIMTYPVLGASGVYKSAKYVG